jgi:hypothetical protein
VSYSNDRRVAARAKSAMGNLEHVRMHYSYWLGSIEYLKEREADIFFVGFQEFLNEDFRELLTKLSLDQDIHKLPTSSEKANVTRGLVDANLGEDAILNLKKWYAEDYEIYQHCKKMRSETK